MTKDSLDIPLSQFRAMFGSNCCFLTCIQVSKEEGKVVWYSYLFQNLPQCVVIYRVKYEFYLFILFIFWNISEKNDENLLNVNSIYLSVLSMFLREGIATHSSILAWRIPRTEEPGGLQSIGSEEIAQAHTELYKVTLFCCFTCFYKFLIFFNQHSSVLRSAPSPYGSGFELTNVKLCAFWKVEAKGPSHLVVITSQRQWEADPEVHVSSGFPPLPSLCLAVLADCRIHWLPAPQAHHHMLFCELT